MSLPAIIEFIQHLEYFRNVDLIQQGIYFFKFQIFNEDKDKIYYANPYHFESKDERSAESASPTKKGEPKVSFHKLIEPYTVE